MRSALADVWPSEIRYHASIGSTNDEALAWVKAGAADLSVVVADEQTHGRGRMKRQWFTPAGSALAMSVILRPGPQEVQPGPAVAMRLTALGAVAVATALERYHLQPHIKWPNDILLDGHKTAGVLVETTWEGDRLEWAVVGIGINVSAGSLPPDDQLRFPATCVEAVLGHPIPRVQLLREILIQVAAGRKQLTSPWLWQAWQARLAYRNEYILIDDGVKTQRAKLIGLDENGGLRVTVEYGKQIIFTQGEIRPILEGSQK